MSAVGMIFSNVHDRNIPELTQMRTMASVPYGCRYRFIDFALSNMVNSGIQKVGVITQSNYQSLMDHIGNGKDWDLASRSGGIKILPPHITAFASASRLSFATRLSGLINSLHFIERCKEDYVVMSDCDVICNIDFRKLIDAHEETGADITIAVKNVVLNSESCKKNVIINSDDEGRAKDIFVYPTEKTGAHDISLNIMVMKREFLHSIIHDSKAHDYTSFNSDIIARNINSYKIMTYKYDGYFACVSSFAEYYSSSMELLKPDIRNALFNIKDRPVLTKVRNSSPTRYGNNSSVKNSLIADGCVIEGTVENSIIFRGVKVSRGTCVKNSIIMQDCEIGENVVINCSVLDKNVVVRDCRVLSGHETKPYFAEKGIMI